MKILFISSKFHPEVISGGQISSYYLAKSLADRNHEVHVLTLYQGKKILLEKKENINYIRIPKIKFLPLISNLDFMWLHIAINSIRYVKKIKPDIVHLVNFEPIFYTPIFLKFLFPKIPIITTVNGPLFGCFTQNATDFKNRTCTTCRVQKRFLCSVNKWGKVKGGLFYIYSLWYMALLKISYCFINRFFAVSKAMQKLLENIGIPQNKIKVIYNPFVIDHKKLTKLQKQKLRKKYNVDSKKVILFAGRLTKDKGIHRIIKALKKIKNVMFFIVGNKRGDYTELKSLVMRLRVSDKVKFLGFLEHKELSELYQITDLVVLPETFFEPLSRLLIEAQLVGVTTIATNMGGNSEIIKHGETGILLRNTDQKKLTQTIKKVLDDERLRKKFGSEAKTGARKKFDINRIGEQLEKEYKNLFDK